MDLAIVESGVDGAFGSWIRTPIRPAMVHHLVLGQADRFVHCPSDHRRASGVDKRRESLRIEAVDALDRGFQYQIRSFGRLA